MDLQDVHAETGTSQARDERAVITAPRLAEIWPTVRLRLIRRLAVVGVDRDPAEDIAQEVALRALACGLAYSDEEDFCRWAFTVARNLHIDNTRLRAKVTTVVELPDKPDGRDITVEVEQRMRLSRTFEAMATMRESDRRAIVDGLTTSGRTSRTVAVRLAVRRHRARARLLRLVEGVTGIWAWVRYPARPELTAQFAAAATAAVVAVPAVVVGAGAVGGAMREWPAAAVATPRPFVLRDVAGPVSVAPPVPAPMAAPGLVRSSPRPDEPDRPEPPESPRPTPPPIEISPSPRGPDSCVFNSGELPEPVPTCWNPPGPGPEPEPPTEPPPVG